MEPQASEAPRLGAYGLELVPSLSPSLLVPLGLCRRPVDIVRDDGRPAPVRNCFDDACFEFSFGDDGGLVVIPEPGQAFFRMTEPLSDAELVHPYLAPVGAAFAWWAGREAFHAGAFVAEDGVWAVVGDKGKGKSSILAGLAVAGYDVMSDDLLVVDAGTALAGPRCLDLRFAAAERLGVGEPTMRGREKRWRFVLGPVQPELPLAGWIFLEWDERLSAASVPGSERLGRLARNRALFIPPRQPSTLLDLVALPTWEVRRCREWDSLPQVLDCLLELTTR